MAKGEIPPNLMSWGMVVVVGGGGRAAEKRASCWHFFCSFNLNSYVEHSVQVCKYVEYTKFKLTL
jgi:hypothetical protein